MKPTAPISAIAHHKDNLLMPYWAKIQEIKRETNDVSTYWLSFEDEAIRNKYQFAEGQFNMLYIPGYGEAAISISSDPNTPKNIGHTIRFVGNVTNEINRLRPGDKIGLRGPFGTAWPVENHKGYDFVLAAGGIGLAPLRPAIYKIINNREDYGEVTIIYGARSPKELLYQNEYEEWKEHGIEVITTVDRADDQWQGLVGVVPMQFYRLRLNTEKTLVFSCGPEIMMRFVVFEGLARRIPQEKIYLSLERNMKCGQGSCGHCQIGPYFICKEGPVYRFDQLEPYFNLEDL